MERSTSNPDSAGRSRRGVLGVLCGSLLGLGVRKTSAEGVQQTARVTATGFYDGTNRAQVVATNLTRVLSFRVVQARTNGPGAQAHKTVAMENFPPLGVTATEATGVFLNGDRVDAGIQFVQAGRVIIDNADFVVDGSRYYWEAQGE